MISSVGRINAGSVGAWSAPGPAPRHASLSECHQLPASGTPPEPGNTLDARLAAGHIHRSLGQRPRTCIGTRECGRRPWTTLSPGTPPGPGNTIDARLAAGHVRVALRAHGALPQGAIDAVLVTAVTYKREILQQIRQELRFDGLVAVLGRRLEVV